MIKKDSCKIYLLDCTLRDGGNCLEDILQFKDQKINFSDAQQKKIISDLRDAHVDIIELGVMEQESFSRRGFSYFEDMESSSRMIPVNRDADQLYVIGSNIPPNGARGIPQWEKGFCDGVRVYLKYSELQESLSYCAQLCAKGYKVFLQNALTMRYTEDDLKRLMDASNEMGAYAVYFVDSNGYMDEGDVERFAAQFDENLDKSIKIGFHAHNHMNLAFSNVRHFLRLNLSHDIIIDSCIAGMGRGAGNLQTELIVPYLNNTYGECYNLDPILDSYEIISEHYINENMWGYSIENLLAAIHQTTNKYTIIMRERYKLSYKRINHLLAQMPKEFKYRYTEENLQRILALEV